MDVFSHDPREHVRGIHQILVSDKKRIGFLFGAGSSFATGSGVKVPAINEMTDKIVLEVEAKSDVFRDAVNGIKGELLQSGAAFNIETLLSNIEAKRSVIGGGALNGLNAEGFLNLANFVKEQVVKLVSIHESLKENDDRKKIAHSKLANWIQKARRRYPAEIFTTNYDFLFEIALEGSGIPYFDGFSGGFEPFFCPEAVEDIEAYPHLVKLWKMHGSLGWIYRESDKAVIRQQSAPGKEILIYPSHLKYSSSKKQPYVGLIDRLCAFLQQDDAVLFTCGYSFGDDHINERIVTSLRRGANSHVIAMYYDELPDVNNTKKYALTDEKNHVRQLATQETNGKMSAYGLRHAVIGGKFGEWKLRDEPKSSDIIQLNRYFDEDAAIPSEEEGEQKGNELWRGAGKFLLPDFPRLAEFLNDLSSSNGAPVNG